MKNLMKTITLRAPARYRFPDFAQSWSGAWRAIPFFSCISLLLTVCIAFSLSGCTAHYRQSLRDFNQGATSSFYQRTLDWSRRAESAASATSATLATVTLRQLGSLSPTPDQDPFARLAGEVLGLTPAQLARARERLMTPPTATHNAQPDPLSNIFQQQVRWDDLKLAVAFYNPEVRAARQDWQATLRQYEQADYLEGLLGQFRAFTRNLNVETGEPLNRQMAQAWFPYPGASALKGDMIRQMARMAELDWQRMLRDGVVRAGEKFFEYQYLARARAASRENVDLLGQFVKVLEERYRTALIPQSELLRGQNELALQRNTLLDLESRTRTSQAQLNALLGRAAEAPLGPPEAADLALPNLAYRELNAAAQARRQEILAQQAAIARTQAAIRMSEVMNRPPASPGASTFERGMMAESSAGSSEAGGAPAFGEKNAPTAPRYAFAQAEAWLAESRLRVAGDQLRLENLQLQTQAEARSALEDLDAARRRLTLLEGVTLPQNQTIYNISLTDYTSGSTTFVELLDAGRELVNTRLMVQEARRDLNQAILRLAAVTGYLVSPPPPDHSSQG